LGYIDDNQLPPVVLINQARAIRMERLEGTLEPYLTFPEQPKFYPDRFKEAYQAAMVSLFEGGDPAQIEKSLRNLQTSPGLLCRGTASCDEYYYVLGLAAELAGNPSGATEAYLRLWRDYGLSPFTTMARLKLMGISATQTPSPFTPTIAIATTTLASTTPTFTATPGTALVATPTATRTVTPQGTPYPEATTPVATEPYPEATTPVATNPYP